MVYIHLLLIDHTFFPLLNGNIIHATVLAYFGLRTFVVLFAHK